jgi:hypothetical protein
MKNDFYFTNCALIRKALSYSEIRIAICHRKSAVVFDAGIRHIRVIRGSENN